MILGRPAVRGWYANLDGARPDSPAVALVVKKGFPEPELVREVLSAAPPDTIFVVRDKDEEAKTILKGMALPYVSAPLNPFWQGKRKCGVWKRNTMGELRLKEGVEVVFDRRSVCRAEEILNTCHRVIVFTTPGSTSEQEFIDTPLGRYNLRIVERGKAPKKRHAKGKKIQ